MSDPITPALQFELTDDGRLLACFDPAGRGASQLDQDRLADAIANAGWGDLQKDPGALESLLKLAACAREPFQIQIAERRDASCTVTVADDAMTAKMDLTPAFGGAEPTRVQVDAALQQAGVVSGVLDDVIDRILTLGCAQGVVVARGRVAIAGRPAEFHSLLPSVQTRGPTVDERGIADYRELGTLVTVRAGDPLMRRVPAVPGVAGEDVFGRVIPAPSVADPDFSAAITGASPSADDPQVLLADIAGQPMPIVRGVTVHPTISVPAVDLHSGNIDVDGTVNVRGDVAAGMHVRATGDVFVAGTVEAATIEAGGSITIAAGAIGRVDGRGASSSNQARLAAGGTVTVRFCENAIISAGADLQIGEFALHSDLTAGQRITIGAPGGRRSQLIGGVARAGVALQVGVLGSNAGVPTQVEVGYEPEAHAQVAAIQQEIARNETRLESLHQVLAYTETLTDEHHRELRERALRSLEASEQTHVELLDRLAEARARLVMCADPRVVVGQAAHAGVELRLGHRTMRTPDDSAAGDFMLVDGEIHLVAR